MTPWQLRQAIKITRAGGIIAYPTEAVFGLGCDPLDIDAVKQICSMKQRSIDKGLILIVSSIDQATPYTSASNAQLKKLLSKTRKPTTWIFPASHHCPLWISGKHDSVAIRLTQHPVASQLCTYAGHALVSTSANISHRLPLRKAREIQRIFGSSVNMILHDEIGDQSQPSEIRDSCSGKKLR